MWKDLIRAKEPCLREEDREYRNSFRLVETVVHIDLCEKKKK